MGVGAIACDAFLCVERRRCLFVKVEYARYGKKKDRLARLPVVVLGIPTCRENDEMIVGQSETWMDVCPSVLAQSPSRNSAHFFLGKGMENGSHFH